jgi:hypothetical protein
MDMAPSIASGLITSRYTVLLTFNHAYPVDTQGHQI